MANLTITTENLGIKFYDQNSGAKITFNEFSIKRYSGSNRIVIVSDIKENYAEFIINFDSYTAVTWDASPIATIDALETALDNVTFASSTIIAGSVANFAALPSPASAHVNELWYVSSGSGGFLTILNVYKYPKGFYSPNASNVWEQVSMNVKVAEDSTTLVNITNWADFYAYAFDVGIGDRIIFNNLEYRNLTGAMSATVPSSDNTNWAVAYFENTLTVAKSGGQYTSIATAITAANAAASSTDRQTVIVYPGVYTEPAMSPSVYVDVVASSSNFTTKIIASSTTSPLFTAAGLNKIKGFIVTGVTGNAAFLINTVGFAMNIEDCTIYNCQYGIRCTAGLVVARSINTAPLGSMTSMFYANGGNIQIDSSTVQGSATITTYVHIDSSSDVRMTNFTLNATNITTGIYCQASSSLSINSGDLHDMVDAIVMEGGSYAYIQGIHIADCTNDGVRINNVGSNTRCVIQGAVIEGNTRYDINILSATATLTGTGETNIDKFNFVAGAKLYGTIIDTKEDDEGFNVIGELHVGLPELGVESVFGEGDSYTRGMLVYTETFASVFTDVSSAAKSASGSTFTFPGTAVNNAVYISSTLYGADYLKHHGIKTNVTTAAVKGGTGVIVAEYWNGSAWAEFNGMEVDSGNSYLPHAKEYFESTGSKQLRYDIALSNGTWTKNDPMSLGTSYYWVRFRINIAITTAPIFEQFKLHTNRSEINADGFIEYFGKARGLDVLPWDAGLLQAANSSPGNQDVYVGDFVNVGRIENEFINGATDRLGFLKPLPYSIDTSSKIKFQWSVRTDDNTLGNIDWTVRWAWSSDGLNVYGDASSAPATAVNQQSINLIDAAPAQNTEKWYQIELDISETISRRNGGFPDTLWVTLQRSGGSGSDTHSGDVSLIAINAEYKKWAEGGHV